MADNLVFWHPANQVELPAGTFNWGAVPAGSTADLRFRIRNASTVYTAVSVAVTIADTGTLAFPAQSATHLFSTNGAKFVALANLGDLAPLVVSVPIILRRVVPTDAQRGTFTFRIDAIANSWQH